MNVEKFVEAVWQLQHDVGRLAQKIDDWEREGERLIAWRERIEQAARCPICKKRFCRCAAKGDEYAASGTKILSSI